MLNHHRKAIGFRKSHRALQKGDHDGVKAAGDVVYFTRHLDGETIFCAINLSDTTAAHDLPPGTWATIGAELGSIGPGADNQLHLGPWQVALACKT